MPVSTPRSPVLSAASIALPCLSTHPHTGPSHRISLHMPALPHPLPPFLPVPASLPPSPPSLPPSPSLPPALPCLTTTGAAKLNKELAALRQKAAAAAAAAAGGRRGSSSSPGPGDSSGGANGRQQQQQQQQQQPYWEQRRAVGHGVKDEWVQVGSAYFLEVISYKWILSPLGGTLILQLMLYWVRASLDCPLYTLYTEGAQDSPCCLFCCCYCPPCAPPPRAGHVGQLQCRWPHPWACWHVVSLGVPAVLLGDVGWAGGH